MTRIGEKEEITTTEGALGGNLSGSDEAPQLERPQVREKVDSIIHQWLTDLWLLLTGENLEEAPSFLRWKDGHALAIFCGGQLRLVESKLSVLDSLRSVGIEMS